MLCWGIKKKINEKKTGKKIKETCCIAGTATTTQSKRNLSAFKIRTQI